MGPTQCVVCVFVLIVVSVQTLNYETTLWGNIGMDLWLTTQ